MFDVMYFALIAHSDEAHEVNRAFRRPICNLRKITLKKQNKT